MFYFRINKDETRIYASPQTKIRSGKTEYRAKSNIPLDKFGPLFFMNGTTEIYKAKFLNRKQVSEILLAKDAKGNNLVGNCIYSMENDKLFELLNCISENQVGILMSVNKSNGNILHTAASVGNIDFLKEFKLNYKLWGLNDEQVKTLLTSLDIHSSIPYQMAYFQQMIRKRERQIVLNFLLEWMNELELYCFTDIHAMLQQVEVYKGTHNTMTHCPDIQDIYLPLINSEEHFTL